MIKSTCHLIILIILVTFQSCRNSGQKAINYNVDNSDNSIITIDFKNIEDSITLKISDIVKDIKFVKLETNDASLMKVGGLMTGNMNRGTIWVGEKYILVLDQSMGIFQFSSEGKFIRKLVSPGSGPCEFGYPTYTVDESGSGTIYITDPTHPESIMRFNMTTGECLSSIPRALTGFVESLLIADDSTILCTPLSGNGEAGDYFIYSQTFDGKFISGIRNTGLIHSTDNRMDELCRIKDLIYFQPLYYDTVFIYKNQKLRPKMIIKSGNQPGTETKGKQEGNIKISIEINTQFHAILAANQIKENKRNQSTGVTISSVFLDKLHKRTYKINSIENDLLYGFIQPGILSSTSKGNLFYAFTAPEFTAIATSLEKTTELKIDSNVKDQIIQLNKIHTSFDNPVIMIGKSKPYRK